ncbi:MAG TPA: hypothetical protein VGH91_04960 [Gammaproteobacteria bacterium]|jgi:hypothetical protein
MNTESQETQLNVAGSQAAIPPTYLKILIAIGAAIVILLAVIAVKLFSAAPPPPLASAPTAQDSDSEATPDNTPAPAAPLPDHNYVYEKNGMYGYQQELSQDDVNSGTAAKPLMMIRYLGVKNGVYRAMLLDESDTPGASNIISCSSPCAYMTLETVYGGQVLSKQTVPTSGTMGGGILSDAMNNKLQVYGQKDK